jgi:hypothetical protein
LQIGDRTVSSEVFGTSPDAPYQTTIKWTRLPDDDEAMLILNGGEEEILRIRP